MQRRFLPLAICAALALTGCADQIPTLADDDEFPAGSIPVTREVLLPASAFFALLGSWNGSGGIAGAPYQVIARDFDGLNAHGLNQFFGFPATVAYQRNGAERRDSLFSYVDSRIVLRVDTAASTAGPFTLRVYAAAQAWQAATATWVNSVDTAGTPTPWTEPGGTRGALLGEATFANSGGADTLVVPISGASVAMLADSASFGVIVTLAETGRRVQLADVVVRAHVRPDSAAPDTTIVLSIGSSGSRTTVFTPDQPAPGAGVMAIGGVRSARSLVRIDPRQLVPGCAVGATCADVPLSSVRLNEVAVLFAPRPVPDGYAPLAPLPISLRVVQEPGLGRFAPLGPVVGDRDAVFSTRDTQFTLPITALAATLALNDTLPTTFALVSESPVTPAPPTFGVAFFSDDPILRIVYTLPSRRRLP